VHLSALTIFAKSKAEKQAEARKKPIKCWRIFYQAKPTAPGAIKAAAGYAVFSNAGMPARGPCTPKMMS